MEYITFKGQEYIHIQAFAEAIGVSTASVYNWRKAGHLSFAWPLGRAMTFVDRQTAERFIRLKITHAMGAFVKDMET